MNSLYIHIPFCEKKCLYCSFVVAIGQRHRAADYLNCLRKEAQSWKGTRCDSVYIGGGTPTFLENDQLKEMAEMLHDFFPLSSGAEVTIESNPEGMDLAKARLLRQLGFNRISLGLQSLNDAYLKFLGRCHDRAQALRAYEILREGGFSNINLDLMFSFPGQTAQDIEDDVRAVCHLKSQHLSLYSLTIEENSRFYAQKMTLDDDQLAEQYLLVVNLLEQFGLKQYEISNFAQPGKEARHNRNYWLGGDYIGLGVGAHSHQQGRRWWNVSRLADYMDRINRKESPLDGEECLFADKRLMERLLFGLRMNEGVDTSALEQEYAVRIDPVRKKQIADFITQGFLNESKGRLIATSQGRLILEEICARLI